MRQRLTVSMVVSLIFVGAAAPAQPPIPVAVSPGRSQQVSAIADRCPTFSWGAVPEARTYELVVFRFGDDGGEARTVLSQSVPGSALSWTPALDRCLERRREHAWSVRAVGEGGPSPWSQARRFEVGEAELVEALAVVERYLAGRRADGEAVPVAGDRGGAGTTAQAAFAPAAPAVLTGESAVLATGDSCCDGRLPSAYSARLGNTKASDFPDVLALELPSKTKPETNVNYLGFFDWDPAQNAPRLVGELEAWWSGYSFDESIVHFTGTASISGWERIEDTPKTCTPNSILCLSSTQCPGGKEPVGGGFEVVSGDPTGLRLVLSHWVGLRAWWVEVENTAPGTTFSFRAVAVCADVGDEP